MSDGGVPSAENGAIRAVWFEIPECSAFLGTCIPRISPGPMICSMLHLLVLTSCKYSRSSPPVEPYYPRTPSVNHVPKVQTCVALFTEGCLGGSVGEGRTQEWRLLHDSIANNFKTELYILYRYIMLYINVRYYSGCCLDCNQ